MKHLSTTLLLLLVTSFVSRSQTVIEWFDSPSGIDSGYWSVLDYQIPVGMKLDSVYGAFDRPSALQDFHDYYLYYCSGTDPNCPNPTQAWDYVAETTTLYDRWIDLTSMNFQDVGVVRVGLPTYGGWAETYDSVFYLPDGSGQIYSTTFDISAFGVGAVIQDSSEVGPLCITMEHSYLGDLEVELECPNGQTVTVFNSYGPGGLIPGGFNGGGIYLGDPLDNNIASPGIGWEYCFDNQNATFGTLGFEYANNNTIMSTLTPGPSMNPNGIYRFEESTSSLIGCPLNGNWTLRVQDNLSIDDGYIFDWSLALNPPGSTDAIWDSVGFALSPVVGVDEYLLTNLISVFPNPTDGVLNISSDEKPVGQVQVFSAIGALLLDERNVNVIDLERFEYGVYLVMVYAVDGELIGREKVLKR